MFLGLERKVVFRIRRKDHGSITWTELNVAGHESCLISLEQCWCWSRDELVTWDHSSSSTPHQSGHGPGHVVWAELRGWRLLHCWLMIGRVEVTVDLYTETEWFQIFLTQSSSSRCFPHQLSFCWSENGFLQNQFTYICLDIWPGVDRACHDGAVETVTSVHESSSVIWLRMCSWKLR